MPGEGRRAFGARWGVLPSRWPNLPCIVANYSPGNWKRNTGGIATHQTSVLFLAKTWPASQPLHWMEIESQPLSERPTQR
jgi:hypothetical protein